MCAIAFALVCAVKFVNSFVRRQHLFDMAATPTDVDANFPFPCPCFNIAQNVIVKSVAGSDYLA